MTIGPSKDVHLLEIQTLIPCNNESKAWIIHSNHRIYNRKLSLWEDPDLMLYDSSQIW